MIQGEIAEMVNKSIPFAVKSSFADAYLLDDDGTTIMAAQINIETEMFASYEYSDMTGKLLELEQVPKIYLMQHDEGAFYSEFCDVFFSEFTHAQCWASKETNFTKDDLRTASYVFDETEFYAAKPTIETLKHSQILCGPSQVEEVGGQYPYLLTREYIIYHGVEQEKITFKMFRRFKLIFNGDGAVSEISVLKQHGKEARKYLVNKLCSLVSEKILKKSISHRVNTDEKGADIKKHIIALGFNTAFPQYTNDLPF